MAINNTVLNDAIAILSDQNTFNKYENRLDTYSAFNYHRDNAPILASKQFIEDLKQSARQPVKIPVLNKTPNSFIDVRSCDISVPESTSEFYTLTWGTLGFTAGISPAVNVDNYITADQQLADQIKSGVISVMEELETLSVANLETGKTTVFKSNVYTDNGSEYEVPIADKDSFYQNVPSVMRRQVLSSNLYDDITNTESQTLQLFLANQGASNDNNSEYQFSTQRYNFYMTNGIVPATAGEETHYMCDRGAAGVYEWIDIDARMGNRISESNYWTEMSDPIMGMDWGVYYKGACADESAKLLGLERTFTQAWEFSKDFAFVTARNSSGDTPIVKFVIS